MPTRSPYSCLRKLDDEGTFKVFTPLRAVGLSVEEGHRVARRVGRGRLEADLLACVRISGGSLEVCEGGVWRKVRQYTLRLLPHDAELARQVVLEHRALFADMLLNVWAVDQRMPHRLGFFDLLGDFSTEVNYGILGKLWVDLKVFSSLHYESKVLRSKAKAEEQFANVVAFDETIESVMLVTACVDKDGARWLPPSLDAWLFFPTRREWMRVAGGLGDVTLRGKADPAKKPPLSTVLRNVTWVEHPDTNENVCYLKHFLAQLGLTTKGLNARSDSFNAFLRRKGLVDRVCQADFPDKCGGSPWVLNKRALRCLYKAL